MKNCALDTGLLSLRLGLGGMMVAAHGWPKLIAFGEKSAVFPDPLGVGSPVSLALAVLAEVVCALLVMAGLATRLAAGPLIVTMLVAAFIVHADDPWQKQEFALLYAIPFAALVLTGGGRWSLDELLARWRSRRCASPASGRTARAQS